MKNILKFVIKMSMIKATKMCLNEFPNKNEKF